MTIRDLYAYAQELGVEDHEIEIQYCDAGGDYPGTRELEKEDIAIKEDVVVF